MSPVCKIINNNAITNTTTITRHWYGTASYFMNLLVFMDQYLFFAIDELCHYRKLQEEVPDCSNQVFLSVYGTQIQDNLHAFAIVTKRITLGIRTIYVYWIQQSMSVDLYSDSLYLYITLWKRCYYETRLNRK